MRIYRSLSLCFLIASLVLTPLAAQSTSGLAALSASPRRAADAPPPGPADLPEGAGNVAPLTLVERFGARGASRTVSRTADRIHIALDDGREWLFLRNVIDSRRVMGFLIDHSQKKISTYSESDLRNAVGIHGWTDVLSLGFNPRDLAELAPADDERKIGGLPFVRYTGEAGEVWWNAEQLLAAEVALHDDAGLAKRLTIESIRQGVADSLLQLPMTRFPEYREASYVDWLEGH